MGKGRKVLIEGSLKTSQYEKEGKKYTNTYILASHFDFMDSKKQEEQEEEFTSPQDTILDDLPF